jgi:dynein heavy chain 1
MMEVTSPGGSPSANGLAAGAGGGYQIDPLLILDHLTQVCEITLGASKKELENVGSLLSKARVSDTTQRVQRWAESQAVLYLQKDIASGDVLDGPLDGTSMYLKAGREYLG